VGLFPGWWLGEENRRPEEPYVSPERWDGELRAADFDGIESVCYDEQPPYQQNATILARATNMATQAHPRRLIIMAPCNNNSQYTLALEEYLKTKGFEVDRCPFHKAHPPEQDIISVYELQSLFIHDIAGQEFRDFIDFVCNLRECQLL
jgi:hypothetical protein